MATIGLDKLYYSIITEDTGGIESYGTPALLAKAISADISIELAEGELFADDGTDEVVKEFKKGKISMNINDLASSAAAALLGASVDNNGALVYSAEDSAPYVGIAFRAKRPNGTYRYFWLYKVRFGVPGTSLATKGDSINFSTPTIEGDIIRRNKPGNGTKHPWMISITEGDTNVASSTLSSWFSSVYEPSFTSGSNPPH